MRNSRPIVWIKSARKEFEAFPGGAQDQINLALTVAAEGGMSGIAKPFKGAGSGVFEIALKHRGDAFRVIYTVEFVVEVIAVDAFQKKSKSGIKTPQQDVERIKQRLKLLRDQHR
jgi:phage-related protein